MDAQLLFVSILFLFLGNALLSIIFVKSHRRGSAISIPIGIIISCMGIFYSLVKLLLAKTVSDFSLVLGISPIQARFHVDQLSAFFILLISLSFLVINIYSLGYMRHYEGKRPSGVFYSCLNLFVLSMILVVTSGQLFFFLVAWELMALFSYFLVIFEYEKTETQKAGSLYAVMTHAGTAMMIFAFALIYKYAGTADIALIHLEKIPHWAKDVAFLGLLTGFAVKGGLIPLHIWLPYAHPAAPSNVSALMSGVMLKMSVYGMIRFVIGLLGADMQWWGITILILGVLSTILGVMYALMEHNIKKLLAYSSIENLGIIFMGLGLSLIAQANGAAILSALCLSAALFHTFNHSLFKGLLFLGAGSIQYACGTRSIEKLGGLAKKMPYSSILFLIGALSISSLPPFNGFISEWMVYQSLFAHFLAAKNILQVLYIPAIALLAMAGALAAYCFVKAFAIIYLAVPRTPNAEKAQEVPKSMLAGMSILAALCVVAGIVPGIFTSLFDGINHEVLGVTIFQGTHSLAKLIPFIPAGASNAISPLVMLFFMFLLLGAGVLLVWLLSRHTKMRTYGTWDCGFKQLTPKMEYTATGFSKPIRIVFRWLYRPSRELLIERQTGKYAIQSARYSVSTQSVFEKYLYKPLTARILKAARKLRFTIQMGSIHAYLAYIFTTLVLMFIYFMRMR